MEIRGSICNNGHYVRSMVVISSIAYSISNFRGPLIQELVDKGIKVFALAPDYDEFTRKAVFELGAVPVDISLNREGMGIVRDFSDFIRLTIQLRRIKPDAIFCYFIKPVIYGSIAARIANIKRRFSLVAGLGYVFADNTTRESIKRKLLRYIVSKLYRISFSVCHVVFFQNQDDISYFINHDIISSKKAIRVNGTGVDLDRLLPTPFPTGPITFLLMARLLKEKGIYEYANAAQLIKNNHPNVRFLLLGAVDQNPGGVAKAEIERWVEQGLFEWPGHVTDVCPWIAKSSVYVLPLYYREGIPRSIQEAMAMGRPIITTDNVGCKETVDDGINGFLVPVRDSARLASAMERFIKDPSLITSMGRESRQMAEQRFEVHKINHIMLRAMGIAST